MTENVKEKPTWPIIDGMRWFPGITKEIVDTFPRLVARKDDIYIVTFPRSGTTWTEEIVWQIIHDGKIDYRRLDIRIPYIEGMVWPLPTNPYYATTPTMIERLFESFPSPRVFKSHLPYDLVPKGRDEATKPHYIYVMRNPKDTSVSWYHHRLSFAQSTGESFSWDEFFEDFKKGNVVRGTWFDNVLSWWKKRDDPRILFLKYEDMKKDPSAAVQRIAEFIGEDLSPETRARIVEQTSFNAMKERSNVNYKWRKEYTGEFIRQGQVGDWRNYYTEEQNDSFNKLYAEKMAGTDLAFDYGEDESKA